MATMRRPDEDDENQAMFYREDYVALDSDNNPVPLTHEEEFYLASLQASWHNMSPEQQIDFVVGLAKSYIYRVKAVRLMLGSHPDAYLYDYQCK